MMLFVQVFEWYKNCLGSREDFKWPGWHDMARTKQNIVKINEIVWNNCLLSIQIIANIVLLKKRVYDKFYITIDNAESQVQNDSQKSQSGTKSCLETHTDFLKWLSIEPNLN